MQKSKILENINKKLSAVILSTAILGTVNAGTISIGRDAYEKAKVEFPKMRLVSLNNEIAVVDVLERDLPRLSAFMHKNFNRCGGFIYHDDKQEALSFLDQDRHAPFVPSIFGITYDIKNPNLVKPLLSKISEVNILATIQNLSTNYPNRYFKSETGVKASADIKTMWENLGQGRSDFKVEFFEHAGYPQKSVIATWTGTESAEEIIVIGGHLDSISGYWGQTANKAPGADDNASGIATITEIMRTLLSSDFKPKRTIKFMGYAAEEVGLYGSKDIARAFKTNNQNVVGVAQFDMTAFKGSEKDINFMTDFTNQAQTEFMAKLVDTYVGASWGYSKCGYACSDHASWNSNGYPASIPFESDMSKYNKNIHTDKDTIQVFKDAKHAVKFAKLGVAFAVELSQN